jgi:hypothetical protein
MEQLDKAAEPKLKTKLKINIFIFLVFYNKLYTLSEWLSFNLQAKINVFFAFNVLRYIEIMWVAATSPGSQFIPIVTQP